MKLKDLSFDGVSRDVLLAAVGKNLADQYVAVKHNGWAIEYIQQPSPILIKMALTDPQVYSSAVEYEGLVKTLLANNKLLIKKWLRYGEAMRSQE